MRVYFAADHAGRELKDKLFVYVSELGYTVSDLGAFEDDPKDDYPDYISRVAKKVAKNPKSIAIILGGSGQGEAMMANRYRGVRAAVYYGGDRSIVSLSREHNNANVLSLGARFLGEDEAKEVIKQWFDTPFSKDERHVRRITKLEYYARLGVKSLMVERFGWVGVFLILGAYIANIFGVLSAQDMGYLAANVVGSLFVLVDARQDRNFQAVVINAVWIFVGIIGILRYFL